MKQLMLLERDDLKQLQTGGTISLTLSNGQTVMLGYADAKAPARAEAYIQRDAKNGLSTPGRQRQSFTKAQKQKIIGELVKGKTTEAGHALLAKKYPGVTMGRARTWLTRYGPKGFTFKYVCTEHKRRFTSVQSYGNHMKQHTSHRGG